MSYELTIPFESAAYPCGLFNTDVASAERGDDDKGKVKLKDRAFQTETKTGELEHVRECDRDQRDTDDVDDLVARLSAPVLS